MRYYNLTDWRSQQVSLKDWTGATRIDKTTFPNDVAVSTIFIGIAFDEKADLLYESCIRGKSEWAWKYKTLSDAKQGHAEIVDALASGTSLNPSVGELDGLTKGMENYRRYINPLESLE